MSEGDQLNRIKETAIHSVNSIEQIEAINALAQYGNKAISSITEVIESSEHEQVSYLDIKLFKRLKHIL